MIFLTTGTQFPFDRLVQYIDEWAHIKEEECFAQIGTSIYKPVNIIYQKFLSPNEFNEKLSNARILIGHAGTGTIISGMKKNIPVIIMPRLVHLNEHRSEHQKPMTELIGKIPGLYIANNKKELYKHLENKKLKKIETNEKIIELTTKKLKYEIDRIMK